MAPPTTINPGSGDQATITGRGTRHFHVYAQPDGWLRVYEKLPSGENLYVGQTWKRDSLPEFIWEAERLPYGSVEWADSVNAFGLVGHLIYRSGDAS